MIELNNISKSFGEQEVLNRVNAKFHQGEVNFVIGRSGSGKSVMTKCTVGLLEPDSGHVYLVSCCVPFDSFAAPTPPSVTGQSFYSWASLDVEKPVFEFMT